MRKGKGKRKNKTKRVRIGIGGRRRALRSSARIKNHQPAKNLPFQNQCLQNDPVNRLLAVVEVEDELTGEASAKTNNTAST